jgi:hypothetical protein
MYLSTEKLREIYLETKVSVDPDVSSIINMMWVQVTLGVNEILWDKALSLASQELLQELGYELSKNKWEWVIILPIKQA